MAEIRVPDIGDAENVEVIELCVAPGDAVGPDDAILVIESDKASMEVPAGIAGTLDELLVEIGDEVREGQLIARLNEPESVPESGADERGDIQVAPQEGEPVGSPEASGFPETLDSPEAPHSPGAPDSPETPDSPEVLDSPNAPDKQSRPDVVADAPQPPPSGEILVSVPDIGEAQDVVVIEVAIKPGDRVAEDGLAVVVESDKATMEIPAGAAGVVAAVHVAEGDPVTEGTRLFTLTGTPESTEPSAEAPSAGGREAVQDPNQDQDRDRDRDRHRDLNQDLNQGRDQGRNQDRDREAQRPRPSSPPLAPAKPPGSEIREEQSPGAKVYAGPATRRLARELGVSLAEVRGTGARGRVVKDDIKLFVKQAMAAPRAVGPGSGAGLPPVPKIDFAKFGPVESQPLTRVRTAGARNLRASWLNIPQVTQHDEADVTELEAFRQSLKAEAAARDIKLTPLPFIVKACCYALKEFPTFNASVDAAAENYLLKRYYNVGFAVDSEQGLVVPVLKDADRKGIWELAAEIAELADKVRGRRLAMDDTQGGTFSISSLGQLGGTGFTPIVNAPEVAILGVARLATKPVWDGSGFQPRKMLPLSLSYDHRAINGAEAGRFVGHIIELLKDIRRLSL